VVLSDCDGAVIAGIVARLALGSVFLLAGLLKALNKPDYRRLREAVPLGSSHGVGFGLTAMPFIESSLGIWLLVGTSARMSLIITICLLIGFSVLFFSLARSGYAHGCACFGSSDSYPIGPAHFIRNAVLLLAAVFALFQNERGCKDLAAVDLPIEVITMVIIVLGVSAIAYKGVLEIQNFRDRAGRHGGTSN